MADKKSNEFIDESLVYKTLLESTKAIPWKIDWSTMQFAYIGPQIEQLLGWTQDSWISVNDWATRMHPEDRDGAVNFCVAQSKAGVDHEVDYRALTKDNGYVWIRDVVNVVRNEAGEVESLVGFMFDITERKKTEEKLIALQKELEALSFKDGLTGISNRRMLDTSFDVEWTSAYRSQRPLSLLLIDLDFFKEFNDSYGHVKGDECLKNIAQSLKLAATRPRDVVARFGGEEFAILMPETDEAAALKVAERCRSLIDDLRIPHEKSQVGEQVTVSIGIGTIVPSPHLQHLDFVDAVDKMLYKAKQMGRNRIEVARFDNTQVTHKTG